MGVDFGGTKVLAAVVDTAKGKVKVTLKKGGFVSKEVLFADLTGDLSSHGRKNSSRIEPNIASTPHSFAGRMKSTVNAFRIA